LSIEKKVPTNTPRRLRKNKKKSIPPGLFHPVFLPAPTGTLVSRPTAAR